MRARPRGARRRRGYWSARLRRPSGGRLDMDDSVWRQDIADMLRYRRQAAGLKQVEASKLSGVPQSVLSRWEGGQLSPRADALMMYLECLGVRVSFSRDAIPLRGNGRDLGPRGVIQ
ncbi:MAG: helix-turn-helix domain-containing protein [Armatimonadia bacterium]|nr:helix-turn-helix domain-containing protein [Armatimonadia bacterium]